MNYSLHNTEKKLTTLFVGGAFIFLMIFEGFFLSVRYIFEEQFSLENFESEIRRIESRILMPNEKKRGGPGTRINTITMNASGEVQRGEFRFGPRTETYFEIDGDIVHTMPLGQIIRYDGVLYYKRYLPGSENMYQIFTQNAGYPLPDLFRDILRFLIMNMIILLPFYFMGRYFVKQILKPVEENMNAMGNFVHDSGHELKTPLAIVSGNLQILRKEKTKDDELIEESIKTIEMMGKSIDSLIELTHIRKSEKVGKLSLKNAIENILKQHEEDIKKKGIKIEMEVPENANITMEEEHFQILFGNLLKNAIVYNKENGSITITYKKKVLTVEDTGIGMSSSDVKKIFERFFRVDRSGKYPGSGIGLSLVDRIIKIYNWKISIESKEGVGTSIKIEAK